MTCYKKVYRVLIRMDYEQNGTTHYSVERISNKEHSKRKYAEIELQEAQDNPQFAGYVMWIGEYWIPLKDQENTEDYSNFD